MLFVQGQVVVRGLCSHIYTSTAGGEVPTPISAPVFFALCILVPLHGIPWIMHCLPSQQTLSPGQDAQPCAQQSLKLHLLSAAACKKRCVAGRKAGPQPLCIEPWVAVVFWIVALYQPSVIQC